MGGAVRAPQRIYTGILVNDDFKAQEQHDCDNCRRLWRDHSAVQPSSCHRDI